MLGIYDLYFRLDGVVKLALGGIVWLVRRFQSNYRKRFGRFNG
jgi:hypothetical protein